MNLFLNIAPAINLDGLAAGGLIGGVLALIAAFLVIFAIICIGIYVYTSFAFMSIAKKTKNYTPGIAWIPVIGPALIMSRAAKMRWWPVLLLIAFPIPFVNIVAIIVYAVFSFIWMWKTYEAVGRPGWWVLLIFIPLVGPIIQIILLGVAAWGEK
ncbi:hypothetical protein HYW76_02415 [Candidatus Pacearchaeota archaeon]|nr:hypothetical protein [Candidatus Pacearchaeota archaeon]